MTQHTQGPWEMFDNGTNTAGIVRYAEDSSYNDGRDSVIICLFKEDGLIPTELAAQEANARLIAAAPELLEALKDMMAHAAAHEDILRENNLMDGESIYLADEAHTMARAAINKAKGL